MVARLLAQKPKSAREEVSYHHLKIGNERNILIPRSKRAMRGVIKFSISSSGDPGSGPDAERSIV
jgi:hypothetical protein